MEMSRNPKRENAHRLAYAIKMNADEITVKELAKLLLYNEQQLRKDINDLVEYIYDLEHEEGMEL